MTPEIDWTRHKGKYSDFNPKGATRPTHPLLKVAGTGKAVWCPDNERWAV